MCDDAANIERPGFTIPRNAMLCRRLKKNLHKILNGVILIALLFFIAMHIKQQNYATIEGKGHKVQGSNSQPSGKQVFKEGNDRKKIVFKVPWRFQLEDDGFAFPRKKRLGKYIVYQPAPLSWPKQLLQFENALIFAYLLDRTLLVPPLIEQKTAAKNDSTQRHLAISNILDFDLLSRVVSLKEASLSHVHEMLKSRSIYTICHDHRLGFWVDFIPAVEDIQLWRMLRYQQFTAFPVRLDDPLVDLMCPGTLQYGNRWGPPMKIKPIIRAIITELNQRKEDVIYFKGDTLSTKDFRFFDKIRTKIIQRLLIFNVQFSNGVNLLMMQLIKYLGQTYNAILSGPIGRNESIRDSLELRLKTNRFQETSKTLLVVSRTTDEKHFKFLTNLGYDLIFESNITKGIQDTSGRRLVLKDLHELCITLLCAYAAKLIAIAGPPEEYFVEHLRLQNISMRDGLVTDNINVRWAKHTQWPKRDERVLLARQNISKLLHDIKAKKNPTGRNVTFVTQKNETSFAPNSTKVILNSTYTVSKTRTTLNTVNVTRRAAAAKKPKSKLDVMVCTFCLYIKRITGEHGCPSTAQWCH